MKNINVIEVAKLRNIAILIGEKTYTGYLSPDIISQKDVTKGLFAFGVIDSADGFYRLVNAPGTYGTFLTKENILGSHSGIDIDDYKMEPIHN